MFVDSVLIGPHGETLWLNIVTVEGLCGFRNLGRKVGYFSSGSCFDLGCDKSAHVNAHHFTRLKSNRVITIKVLLSIKPDKLKIEVKFPLRSHSCLFACGDHR